MKITISIPTLNPKISDLKAAIKSCECQTEKPNEILIVDGGSENINEIKTLIHSFPNVSIAIKPGIFISENRKIAVEKAQGDYLIFLDCDDVLSPFFVETVNRLSKDKPDVILFGSGDQEQKTSPSIDNQVVIDDPRSIQTFFLRFDQTYQKPELRSVWAKAFRTDFLRTNDLPKDRMAAQGEDQIMMYWVSFLAKRIVSLPSFVSYRYTIHPYSTSVTFDPKKVDDFRHLENRLTDCLSRCGANQDKWQEFYYAASCEYSIRLLKAFFCNAKNLEKRSKRYFDFKKLMQTDQYYRESIKRCHLSTCPSFGKKGLLFLYKLSWFKPIFNYYDRKKQAIPPK
jgi:glycosyltransferase involved in cell wall biosynthesis